MHMSKEHCFIRILGRILSWTVFFKALIGFFSFFHVIASLSPWLWLCQWVMWVGQAALVWDRIAEDSGTASAGPQCWAAQTLHTGEIQELELSESHDTQVSLLNISRQLKAQTLLCTPLPIFIEKFQHLKKTGSQHCGQGDAWVSPRIGWLCGRN